MKRFKNGQRVLVKATGDFNAIRFVEPMAGVVVRLRHADDGAWIALDRRADDPGAHPFAVDDASGRGTHVLAYPEDCEAA